MSLTGSQQQTVLRLLAALRPHWRQDVNLPARIQQLLAGNRSFGSRDRRLYRELIYTVLRYLPWIEPLLDRGQNEQAIQLIAWLATDTPSTHAFRTALTENWPPCPASVAARADIAQRQLAAGGTVSEPLPCVLPEWFRDHCPAAFAPDQIDRLLARAPLWLRLQTDEPARVVAEFETRGWSYRRSELLHSAIQVLTEADLTQTEAYRSGQFEIQDLGSQMILESVGVEAGGRWLDACAGAGGKTLQLANLLGPSGHIDAHDIRPGALAELGLRAKRAGLRSITTLRATPETLYDGVLVDAPCSGSGTWRRAPHLKWTTLPAQIESAARQQLELLALFSARVRAGGRLIYATCSLCQRENEDVIAAFLQAHPDFSPVPFHQTFRSSPAPSSLTFLPAQHDTDGFFVASLRRT